MLARMVVGFSSTGVSWGRVRGTRCVDFDDFRKLEEGVCVKVSRSSLANASVGGRAKRFLEAGISKSIYTFIKS